jgi:hypothetical protein
LLASETVGAALAFNGDGRHYYVYRDYADGAEYIRNGRELCNEGFSVSLDAYDYHVFLDFREIWDDEYGTWGKLCQQLEGRGVTSIDEEVKQVRYAALIDQLRGHLEKSSALLTEEFAGLAPADLAAAKEKFAAGQKLFLTALARTAGLTDSGTLQVPPLLAELTCLEEMTRAGSSLLDGRTAKLMIFAWMVLHRCGELTAAADPAVAAAKLVNSFGLAKPLEEELCGEATDAGDRLAMLDVPAVMALFAVLLHWQRFMGLSPLAQAELLPEFFSDRDVARFIGLHPSGGFQWFVKERWQLLLEWLELAAAVLAAGDGLLPDTVKAAAAKKTLCETAAAAGYRLDLLLPRATSR